MTRTSFTKQQRVAPTLFSMTGVLAVVHPHVPRRGTLEAHAREMVAARMALSFREDPPHALQLALMQAYQRGRKVK